GGRREMSRPACRIVPADCTSSPATMRSSVVLPQPEGPRKQMSSPWRTPRLTPFSAAKSPNSLRMPWSSRKSLIWIPDDSGMTSLSSSHATSLFRFRRIPLLPLREDLVAVLRREGEVVLDEARLEIARDVRQSRLDRRVRDDGEVLRVRLVGLLGRGPVHQLLRRVH